MKSSVIDAILSAWKKENEVLTYSEIKKHLVKKKIVKKSNDASPSRWLAKLVEEECLKKTEDGYIMKMKPKDYKIFDYISELRQRYPKHVYEGEIGGWISHVCALAYLNFDETLITQFDERIAFDIISVKLGELFSILYLLKNNILKRRCGLESLKLDDSALREIFFTLLQKSIGAHDTTEELVEKHYSSLGRVEKHQFDKLWEKNNPTFDFDRSDLLGYDIFPNGIEEDPEGHKKLLKEEFSFDVEKYVIEELIDKYNEVNKQIEQKHKSQNQGTDEFFGYTLTKKEQELEFIFRTAINVKIAECIKALGTNTEDFAVILTRHPRTMNKYFTAEHYLYEAMEWAREPPKEEFRKSVWNKVFAEEKNFEGMVANRLTDINSINPTMIKALRSKPWVKIELSKYGSFNKIVKLYEKKLKTQWNKRKNDF